MEYHRRYAEAEEQKMVLQTERLILRRMEQSDFGALCRVLQDEKAMYAYEHAFSDEEAENWVGRQLERYQTGGIGLWAVVQKETGVVIGQCGLTWQPVPETYSASGKALEIGYLFNRRYWHRGYALEAAAGCKKYALEVLKEPKICSIIRDNNTASIHVAERNGLKPAGSFVKHYYGIEMPHIIYSN